MAPEGSARFEVLPLWAKLNEMLVELLDVVPEDRMEWSPKPELWSFRHIFQHLCEAREQWMQRAIADGAPNIDVYANVHSKEEAAGGVRDDVGAHCDGVRRPDAARRDVP